MRIVTVPCLQDNYAYLIICERTGAAAVIDPSEAAPVLHAVEREGVTLTAIWNTHHHWDHTGGNKDLLAAQPGLEVVAHASDRSRVPGQTRFAEHGDAFSLGDEVRAHIIHNPGHTLGAISYHLVDHEAVFTGDTLFGAGCGRLFEGTPEQMLASLEHLASLPEQTRVYFGHEYTAANLRFASAVEPGNPAVHTRLKQADARCSADQATTPSLLAEERTTNPFLRTRVAEIIAAVHASEPGTNDSPVEVFAALRRWKDRWRG